MGEQHVHEINKWDNKTKIIKYIYFFRERIERFIDENKALMKRMYGDFEMSSGYGSPTRETGHHRTRRRRRKSREAVKHDIPDGGPNFRDELNPEIEANGDSFFANVRKTRNPRQSPGKNHKDSGRYIQIIGNYGENLIFLQTRNVIV